MGDMNRIDEPNVERELESKEAGTPSGGDELERLRQDLDRARAEAADYKDKYLRAAAEAENVRRRAEQEVASAHKYAIERFATEILAVRDSLELARNLELGAEVPEAVRKMHEGLDLTLKLLDKVFQQFGLAQIDPQGQKFDPTRQHAISTVESEEVAPHHVVNVVQKGYLLHDRVLRPALVVVSRAREAENPASGA